MSTEAPGHQCQRAPNQEYRALHGTRAGVRIHFIFHGMVLKIVRNSSTSSYTGHRWLAAQALQDGSMVKMPRKVMRYSPAAGKHTEHTVERVKKRRASELKWGQRRFRRVTSGYRGFPRPKPSGDKPTKRVNLIYRCTETGKAHSPKGKRARKFELVDK